MNLAFQPASELARMIRDGEISAQALLEHFLARIDRLNPALNAVVATNREAARQRAKEADAAIARGESWGPLHGVPMTIKDTFEVEGMTTTAGAPALRDHVSAENAASVQRLLDAGAIVFGKTNVPLYAGDLQSYNDIYGTTNNPWDLERTPGGSSGGAAAALAAGLTPLELGSDIGGSIRTPSHFCGVFGLKPSYGVVPVRGHIPGPPGSLGRPDIGVMGPMARNVDDLALALDILAGPDDDDAVGWRLELPPPRHEKLADYRVAAWLDDPACPVDEEIVQALQGVVERLRSAGSEVASSARPEGIDLTASYDVFYSLLTAALSAGMPPKVFDKMLHTAETEKPEDRHYFTRFSRGVTQRHAEWLRLDERRQRMRRSWHDFFKDHDIMLCPVVQTVAFPHTQNAAATDRTLTVNGQEQPYMDIMVWISLAGASYLPAAVVPVGQTKAGLPIGIQIIAPYLEDRTALDFARHVEQLTGGFRIPPGYES
jgi:amidase